MLTNSVGLDSRLALGKLLPLPAKHWNFRLAVMPARRLGGCWRSESSPLCARPMVYPLNPYALKMVLERPGSRRVMLNLPQVVLMLIYTAGSKESAGIISVIA